MVGLNSDPKYSASPGLRFLLMRAFASHLLGEGESSSAAILFHEGSPFLHVDLVFLLSNRSCRGKNLLFSFLAAEKVAKN